MNARKLLDRWHGVPHHARLAVAVLIVQLVFWLIIKPMVIGTPSPGFETIETRDHAHAELARPDFSLVESARFETLESLPGEHCCEPGYRAFRYAFDLETVPETGLGITPHIRADNFAIYANGNFVAGAGRMELPDQTFHGLIRIVHHIPKDTLAVGENEITFILAREGVPYFDYLPPILAEYSFLQDRFSRTEFLAGGYSYLVLAATGMVALFSLIFFLISGREGGAFWLFVLATGLTASSHYYLWYDPPFGGNIRIAYYFAVTLFVQFAWFGWADSWSRKRYGWTLPLVSLFCVIIAGATAYSLFTLPYGPGYDLAGEIIFYSGSILAVATAVRLIWNFTDMQEDRYWEASIALLLVMLFVMQALTELTQALNLGYVQRTQPFLIMGVAIAFFARRVTLFKSAAQINSLLKSQLDERTGELAIAHEREKHLVRKQALDEERQRIMRDMHDGLGSHLMSMLMMAKRGNGEHSDFADGLQSVIDEMRLMIDSMDSVGESLRAALTMFKRRVVPRATEAGFTVNWDDQVGPNLPEYGPRDVLQVFRILQEAITNALKHSGGDQIDIAIRPSAVRPADVELAISDNGRGMDGSLKNGRGLKNMRARAAGIGAEVDVVSDSSGTTVCLNLSKRD